jgi:hypothetical protein
VTIPDAAIAGAPALPGVAAEPALAAPAWTPPGCAAAAAAEFPGRAGPLAPGDVTVDPGSGSHAPTTTDPTGAPDAPPVRTFPPAPRPAVVGEDCALVPACASLPPAGIDHAASARTAADPVPLAAPTVAPIPDVAPATPGPDAVKRYGAAAEPGVLSVACAVPETVPNGPDAEPRADPGADP